MSCHDVTLNINLKICLVGVLLTERMIVHLSLRCNMNIFCKFLLLTYSYELHYKEVVTWIGMLLSAHNRKCKGIWQQGLPMVSAQAKAFSQSFNLKFHPNPAQPEQQLLSI